MSRNLITVLAPFDWKCSNPYRCLFQNFSYLSTHVYAKGNTHTYQETGVMAIGKIYKQIFLKDRIDHTTSSAITFAIVVKYKGIYRLRLTYLDLILTYSKVNVMHTWIANISKMVINSIGKFTFELGTL